MDPAATTETEAPDATPASIAQPGGAAGKRRWTLQIIYCSAAFFVSYVITAGPAVFMARRFDQPMFDRIVRVLYAPLILLVEKGNNKSVTFIENGTAKKVVPVGV